MLRITRNGTATEQRLTLSGQLAGPWVKELEAEWRRKADGATQCCVIDLTDVTFIDEAGEKLLRYLREHGAEFVAKGIETKDLLQNLGSPEKRALRRFLGALTDRAD
jgi:anti-anti-sigma regulatory factor